ncbi:hypothetical protein Plhal703r1_c15g0074731 [Plasmopara halstedii]
MTAHRSDLVDYKRVKSSRKEKIADDRELNVERAVKAKTICSDERDMFMMKLRLIPVLDCRWDKTLLWQLEEGTVKLTRWTLSKKGHDRCNTRELFVRGSNGSHPCIDHITVAAKTSGEI